jgi:UDPglucose 6-dehydrogenase
MKIVVVGLGYVGLSNAVLLAQHNEVIGVDISNDRVNMVNARKSPIVDKELAQYLTKEDLDLSASTDLEGSAKGAAYVIVATPTDYDEDTNFFNTSSVESVIDIVTKSEPKACVVVKSTVPVGFIAAVRERF